MAASCERSPPPVNPSDGQISAELTRRPKQREGEEVRGDVERVRGADRLVIAVADHEIILHDSPERRQRQQVRDQLAVVPGLLEVVAEGGLEVLERNATWLTQIVEDVLDISANFANRMRGSSISARSSATAAARRADASASASSPAQGPRRRSRARSVEVPELA